MDTSALISIFSSRLKQLVEDEYSSITAAGKKANIVQPTMSTYVNGKRLPDAMMLRRLCEAFKVSADWLLGLSDTRSVEADAHSAVNYTGLSPEAVEVLHSHLSRRNLDTLSRLLVVESMSDILEPISKAVDIQKKSIHRKTESAEATRKREERLSALLKQIHEEFGFETLSPFAASFYYIQESENALHTVANRLLANLFDEIRNG